MEVNTELIQSLQTLKNADLMVLLLKKYYESRTKE